VVFWRALGANGPAPAAAVGRIPLLGRSWRSERERQQDRIQRNLRTCLVLPACQAARPRHPPPHLLEEAATDDVVSLRRERNLRDFESVNHRLASFGNEADL